MCVWCVQQKFEFPENAKLAKAVTDGIIQKSVRSHMHWLKAKFYSKVKNITDKQVLLLKQMTITDKDWIDLVKQWKNELYQVIRA